MYIVPLYTYVHRNECMFVFIHVSTCVHFIVFFLYYWIHPQCSICMYTYVHTYLGTCVDISLHTNVHAQTHTLYVHKQDMHVRTYIYLCTWCRNVPKVDFYPALPLLSAFPACSLHINIHVNTYVCMYVCVSLCVFRLQTACSCDTHTCAPINGHLRLRWQRIFPSFAACKLSKRASRLNMSLHTHTHTCTENHMCACVCTLQAPHPQLLPTRELHTQMQQRTTPASSTAHALCLPHCASAGLPSA